MQTSAPSSISPTDQVAAVGSSDGRRPTATAFSAAVTAFGGNSTPVTTRASTRRTLVSSTARRRPKAKASNADAV